MHNGWTESKIVCIHKKHTGTVPLLQLWDLGELACVPLQKAPTFLPHTVTLTSTSTSDLDKGTAIVIVVRKPGLSNSWGLKSSSKHNVGFASFSE